VNQVWREFREGKQFLDVIFKRPWRGPEGYLTVEEVRAWLDLSQPGAYKLIRRHLAPKGGVYRQGRGKHGRAGRLLVSTKAFDEYLAERKRRPRRAGLVTNRRWTRSGPRPVEPKPRRRVRPCKPPTPLQWARRAMAIWVWEHLLSPEERKAIIAKVLGRRREQRSNGRQPRRSVSAFR
jgi:hypothetical protein